MLVIASSPLTRYVRPPRLNQRGPCQEPSTWEMKRSLASGLRAWTSDASRIARSPSSARNGLATGRKTLPEIIPA